MHLAVIGGGWAGLSAAIHATRRGHRVTLYEMSAQLGGRARQVEFDGIALDNGQHIMLGAYRDTLELMRLVGVPTEDALLRTPLSIVGPDGRGLVLPRGDARLAFVRAVLGNAAWSWRDKMSLLRLASAWARSGFECDQRCTVGKLCAAVPEAVRTQLVEPLCVAALNTPADLASGRVFLRVLKDGLFGERGCADLLLPKRSLSALLPEPAAQWLSRAGSRVRLNARVQELIPAGAAAWRVDGERFDAVILAATATEAARLVQSVRPQWALQAAALRHEPIVTVYATSPGARIVHPMTALQTSASEPAQFVFDLQALCGKAGLLAFVISGAGNWVERGTQAIIEATLAQARRRLAACLRQPLHMARALAERRATFACTPGLLRPPMSIAAGLLAAGDYVEGPYPATLEGAVRSGLRAVESLPRDLVHDAKWPA